MSSLSRRSVLGAGAAACVLGGIAPVVRAASSLLRIGYIGAAEEQLTLLIAKPDIGKNHGKAYSMDSTRFRSSAQLAQAWEANAVDICSFSGAGFIFAAAAGVEGTLIASVARESQRGFSTAFYAKDPSDITSVPSMRGKVVGINGFNTAGHLWLIAALKKHDMTDKDVRVTPIGFAAMQESLRAGRVDVGMFPQPFAALLEKQDKVRKIFDAKYGMPFDEELIVIQGKDAYLKQNAEAIRGFMEDIKIATDYYLAHPRESRQLLIDRKMVRVVPEVYLDMQDYYREPTLHIDVDSLGQMQEFQLEAKFQDKRVDVKTLVGLSYLPK